MAYDPRGLRMLSATDTLRHYAYETPDSLTDVQAPAYFARLPGAQSGDIILIEAANGKASFNLTVDVTGGVKLNSGGVAGSFANLSPVSLMAGLGDSITDQNTTLTDPSPDVENARGYLVHAKQLLGGLVDFNRSVEFGVSGQTSSEIRARLPIAIAANPSILSVLAGTNDIGVAFETVRGNLQYIYDTAISSGILVVAVTILSRTDDRWSSAGLTAAQIQFERDKNARLARWQAAYAATRPGLIVVNADRALMDPTTGKTRLDVLADGLHPNAVGAYLIGKAVADALRPRLPVLDMAQWSVYDAWSADNPAGNLLLNGLMFGAAGNVTTSAGITGQSADNWTALRSRGGANADSGTFAVSKVARDDGKPGEWTRIVATNFLRAASDGNEQYALQQAVLFSSGKYASGQRLRACVDYRINSNSGGLLAPLVELRELNGTTVIMQGCAGSVGQSYPPNVAGRIQTPILNVRPGAGTNIVVNLAVQFDPRTAASFSVDFSNVEVRNLDA